MISLECHVPGLEQALVARVVERLLDLEPGAIAVLLTGSYAKGSASVASDLDVMVITSSEPRVSYQRGSRSRAETRRCMSLLERRL